MFKQFSPTDAQHHLKNKLSILILEDHPLLSKVYQFILEKAVDKKQLPPINILKVHTLEKVFHFFEQQTDLPNIVFLDINLPAFQDKKWFSGEDFGIHLRKLYPDIKLMVMTGLVDVHRLDSILQKLNPEAFLVKTEINKHTLVKAVSNVNNNIPFFSPTLLKLIKNQYLSGYNINDNEKELLYLLSIGVPSKEIPNYLPWSLSKVEKQKQLLRVKLGADHCNVLSLIHKARELGMI